MSERKAKQQRRANGGSPASSSGHKRRLTWIAIGVAVVAVAAALVAGLLATRGTSKDSRPATTHANASGPPLELSGTDPVTGRHVDLASFAGKPIVLNVWGSWCPGCNQEASDLRRFERTHRDVQVVGIDLNDTSSGARAFYKRWHLDHPNIADPNGEIVASLGLQGTPTTYFLNRR
ncbi:MAG: TlpA disulfide reductase family protein, partial [Actinomycetota bacterium]